MYYWDAIYPKCTQRAITLLGRGVPNNTGPWGGHKLFERERHQKIFDDQNVGSHNDDQDGVFILFKKTDYNNNFSLFRV